MGIGNADDGLVKIIITEPDSAQHGTVGGTLNALRDDFAVVITTHANYLPRK